MEKKILSKLMATTTVADYRRFTSSLMSLLIDGRAINDKVIRTLADPALTKDMTSIQSLVDIVAGVIVKHVLSMAEESQTAVSVGFDFASLTGMTYDDIVAFVNGLSILEVSNEK